MNVSHVVWTDEGGRKTVRFKPEYCRKNPLAGAGEKLFHVRLGQGDSCIVLVGVVFVPVFYKEAFNLFLQDVRDFIRGWLFASVLIKAIPV